MRYRGMVSINKLVLNFYILQDASDKGSEAIKSLDRDINFSVDELNALSKEEQMNVLYRLGCCLYLKSMSMLSLSYASS